MKRIPGALLVLAIATVVSVLTPAVLAQEEHGEFGVFADMTRLRHLNNTNFWGVGGRLGFNLNHWAQLEGDMAWDFEQQFNCSNCTFGANAGTNTFGNLRLLHGLFGPKFQTGIGPVRVFGVLKGGFLDFWVSRVSTLGTASNQVGNVP